LKAGIPGGGSHSRWPSEISRGDGPPDPMSEKTRRYYRRHRRNKYQVGGPISDERGPHIVKTGRTRQLIRFQQNRYYGRRTNWSPRIFSTSAPAKSTPVPVFRDFLLNLAEGKKGRGAKGVAGASGTSPNSRAGSSSRMTGKKKAAQHVTLQPGELAEDTHSPSFTKSADRESKIRTWPPCVGKAALRPARTKDGNKRAVVQCLY